MRLIRAAAALFIALCAGVFVGAAPAQAGGWATTILDPVPATFEPGKSYTIGFWVLQHGSHPYQGSTLAPVGLQLVGPNGTKTFPATALPEPAHYVTSIHVPTKGDYALVGLQGPFHPYRVGTIAAPGALTALPVPPPMPWPAEKLPWKEIRPPDMPVDTNRDPFDETAALPARPATTSPAATPDTATERTASTSTRPTTTVLAAGAATAVILGLLLLFRRRRSLSSRS